MLAIIRLDQVELPFRAFYNVLPHSKGGRSKNLDVTVVLRAVNE